MEFFEIDNFVPVLKYKELVLHPEFKRVLTNTYNKGCDGDESGNSRNLSKKLFRFFYFYANWKSPYFGNDEKTKIEKSLISSGLGASYRLQKEEKEALSFYESILKELYPQIEILKTLKESLVLIEKGSRLMSNKLNDLVEKLANVEVEDTETSINNYVALETLYFNSLNKLISIGDKVKTVTKDINDIEDELKKVEHEKRVLKGGHEKGDRMDPK